MLAGSAVPILLAAACLTGCHGSGKSPGGTSGGGGSAAVDPCTLYSCDNVVDAVIVPMLVSGGFTPTQEDSGVLCRRMALDLTGLTPTPMEVAQQCTGKTPGQMADYFMNKPTGANIPAIPTGDDPALYAPYVFVNRRWWADNFQYRGFNVFIRDLDRWVGKLYAGQIPYDQFTLQALSSPAFLERFGGDDVDLDIVNTASTAIRIFLGRQALAEEAQDFGNLWRGWTSLSMSYLPQSEVDSLNTMFYGAGCPVDPKTMALACDHSEFGLDGYRCAGPKQAACQSTVFGPYQMIPIKTADADLEQWAVDEASHSSNLSAHFVRTGKLTAPDLDAILTPGRALVARPEFADAAVNAALVKYLRWWRSGTYLPNFEVPAVRDALSTKFRADAYDIRKLEREIVTSLLYVQAAAAAPDTSSLTPLWVNGPTKPVYSEAWLDTMGQAIGTPLWNCDFRYEAASEYAHFQVTGIPDELTYPDTDYGFYPGVAEDLGGCPNASTHADPSGLVASIARRSALARVCTMAMAPALVPGAGATLDSLIDTAFVGVGRVPSAAEKQVLLAQMSVVANGGCDPTKLSSCDLQDMSDALCRSLYATALFNFY